MNRTIISVFMALLGVICAKAMPVEDITLANVAPKAGELDFTIRSLEQITLNFSTEVEVGKNKKATLLLPDGEELTAPLVRNRFSKKTVTLDFPEVLPMNGTYTLTIPKWSVGDAEWVENRETGHSNAEIKVEWTVSNGLAVGVEYDLNPIRITPANESAISYSNGGTLKMVQIIFPLGTVKNPDVDVVLSSVEARYNQVLVFEAVENTSNITYTANVSPSPSFSGDYTLNIPGGAFGDADFIAGNNGHANPPVTYLYSISGNMSEDGELLGGVDYSAMPKAFELVRDGENYNASIVIMPDMQFVENKVAECRLLDEYGYAVPEVDFTFNTEADNTAIISFSANLDEAKRYTLIIPQGFFGTETWINSNDTDGIANPQLTEVFTPNNVTTSVKKIDSTESPRPNDIFTSTGILLHRNATEAQIRTLTPGLYIIAGKKVMVK